MLRRNLALTFVVEVKLFVKFKGAVILLPVFFEVVVDPFERQLGSDLVTVLTAVVPIAAVLMSTHS